ncbi:hypothetical protein P0D88_33065 [Paraburkholderia sp. RL18-103-BIB-C]|uniref:hypothetical protein n=1 Tax=Paraburkholderia sp. RL18-103-BIB-C TaxID=3031637 RepID=UPI0038B7FBEE
MRESSAPAFSIQMAKNSSFRSTSKAWSGPATAAMSWGNLRIDPRPMLQKMLVTFTTPLLRDLNVGGLLTLPAARGPLAPTDIYSLAINRYNKLVLSEDGAKIEHVAAELSKRDDVLVGDASSAISSAHVSGEHAAELLVRATFADIAALVDGEYLRTQFRHSVVIVHKDGSSFWLHWPEVLTEYMSEWFASVVSLERA